MASGHLSGLLMIRPVRLGLLAESKLSSILRAAELASTVWGGLYTPLLATRPRDEILAASESLGVDALFPLDASNETEVLAATPGYEWFGKAPWGPYDEPQEHMSSRLLGPEWLLDGLPVTARPFLPRWESDDPLGNLFAVWFGHYGQAEYARKLEGILADRGEVVDIAPTGSLEIPDGISPIDLTGSSITYSGDQGVSGIFVVDPNEPSDLRAFWNERACGGEVFPWPLGYGDRVKASAEDWVSARAASGAFSRFRRGDGTALPPQAHVVLPSGITEPPPELTRLLSNAGVTPFVGGTWRPVGWEGTHPFRTDFERSFSIETDARSWSENILLPEFPPARMRDRWMSSMIVAAHITLFDESGMGSARTAQVPNIREMANLISVPLTPSNVRRPAPDGRVISLRVSEEKCPISFVRTMQLIACLFKDSGWECAQSDNGRFTARFGEMLSAGDSTSANEPAVREVLIATARSPVGKSIKELEAAAKKHRGAWPGVFLSSTNDEYVRGVPLHLMRSRILRPHLAVRCPECAITMTLRPEDLATTMTCDMCSASFPLGFAMAVGKAGSTWRYRLPSDIDLERLLEALALTATAGALRSPFPFGNLALQQFGVKLSSPRVPKQPPGHSCEVDLVFLTEDRGQAQLLVGEVKNEGYFTDNDVMNLVGVQQWFLSRGLQCHLLFAGMREALTTHEREMLRTACENAPTSTGSQVYPLFPIVLLKEELSANQFDILNDDGWKASGLNDMALKSCKRNLGLDNAEWPPATSSQSWICQWI